MVQFAVIDFFDGVEAYPYDHAVFHFQYSIQ
jgi:hypothetical protein